MPAAAAAQAQTPFRYVSYDDAVSFLNQVAKREPEAGLDTVVWGSDIDRRGEKRLLENLTQNRAALCVIDHPSSLKPFYMRRNGASRTSPRGGETVASFDVLLPIAGEVVGGSLREERLAELQRCVSVLPETPRENRRLRHARTRIFLGNAQEEQLPDAAAVRTAQTLRGASARRLRAGD